MARPIPRLARHWPTWLVPGALIMACVIACAPSSSPSDVTQSGDDLIASGTNVRVTDSVPGDLIAMGRDIHVTGATEGDYLGAGQQQLVGGRIHGALRAAGREVRVTARVDRNASVAAGRVVLEPGAQVARSAYLAGGSVRVDGFVGRVLKAAGRTVVVNGDVGGDVDVTASELYIGAGAVIGGELRYRVPASGVHIDPAARIAGRVTVLPESEHRGTGYVFGILLVISFLISGAVIVALFPAFLRGSVDRLRESPGRVALWGLAWLVLAPLGIFVVGVTIIGLPLAVLVAMVYGALLYLGRIPIAIWIGRMILGSRAAPGRMGAVASFCVGALLLLVVRFVPLLGTLVLCVATVLGIGALLRHLATFRPTRTVSSGV